jgi:hypothetical protein
VFGLIFVSSLLNFEGLTGKVVDDSNSISGLVGYWNFEDNTKDFSGNGNDGIAVGITYKNGKSGKAGYFNGSSYVYGKNTLIQGNEITQCAWVQQNETNSFPVIFNLFNNESSRIQLYTLYKLEKMFLHKQKFRSSKYASKIFSTQTNKWYFICGVFSKNNYRAIYLDGKKMRENSDLLNFSYNLNSWSIGSTLNSSYGSSSSLYNFIGLIDEVRVYNRMLSEDEINKLYLLNYIEESNNQSDTNTEDKIDNSSQASSNQTNNSETENQSQNSTQTNKKTNLARINRRKESSATYYC